MKNFSDSYKEAGVDVTAGYKAVELMKQHVARTNIPGVVSNIGSFGGLFQPDFTDMKTPILVSGTDGVGTKLRLAFLMDKHDTIGVDCVAMCVNDVICCGAQPLFFLDYLAVGKNFPEKIEKIVIKAINILIKNNLINDAFSIKENYPLKTQNDLLSIITKRIIFDRKASHLNIFLSQNK